jgi:hypothetical protein
MMNPRRSEFVNSRLVPRPIPIPSFSTCNIENMGMGLLGMKLVLV